LVLSLGSCKQIKEAAKEAAKESVQGEDSKSASHANYDCTVERDRTDPGLSSASVIISCTAKSHLVIANLEASTGLRKAGASSYRTKWSAFDYQVITEENDLPAGQSRSWKVTLKRPVVNPLSADKALMRVKAELRYPDQFKAEWDEDPDKYFAALEADKKNDPDKYKLDLELKL